MRNGNFIILYCLIGVFAAAAMEGDGGYAGAFLRMGIGARAKAMGDAHTAIPENAVAGFYNPALLPHLKQREVALSFTLLPLDRRLDFVGYAQSLRPKVSESEGEAPLRAGFALAWIHAGVDNIDGRDLSGRHTQYLSDSEHAFYLSFALNPTRILSIGVSGKILYHRLPNLAFDDGAVSSRGFGIDFGAFLTPLPNLGLAVVLLDNNSKYTWNTDKVWERGTSITYKFPKTIRTAVAYRIPQDWLLVTAELEDSKEQNPRYHLGAEISNRNLGALRLGMDHNRLTFGAGFWLRVVGREVNMNYAYIAPDVTPGADHVFSWAFTF